MTTQSHQLARPSRHDEWRSTLLQAWQDKRSLPTFAAQPAFPAPDDRAWLLFHARSKGEDAT